MFLVILWLAGREYIPYLKKGETVMAELLLWKSCWIWVYFCHLLSMLTDSFSLPRLKQERGWTEITSSFYYSINKLYLLAKQLGPVISYWLNLNNMHGAIILTVIKEGLKKSCTLLLWPYYLGTYSYRGIYFIFISLRSLFIWHVYN